MADFLQLSVCLSAVCMFYCFFLFSALANKEKIQIVYDFSVYDLNTTAWSLKMQDPKTLKMGKFRTENK